MTNCSNVSFGLPSGPPRSSSWTRGRCRSATALGGTRAAQLDGRVRAEHELDAGLDHAAEATLDPAAALGRRLDDEPFAEQLDRAQVGEPDPVGRLVDHERQLRLHARPCLLKLGTHCSARRPPPGSVAGTFEVGPRRARSRGGHTQRSAAL